MQPADTENLERWIMSFGANARVLKPAELVEDFREDLRRMQEAYAASQEVFG